MILSVGVEEVEAEVNVGPEVEEEDLTSRFAKATPADEGEEILEDEEAAVTLAAEGPEAVVGGAVWTLDQGSTRMYLVIH